jgi:hypothetical protein
MVAVVVRDYAKDNYLGRILDTRKFRPFIYICEQSFTNFIIL